MPSWTVKIRPADLPDEEAEGGRSRRVANLSTQNWRTLHGRLEHSSGSPYELVPSSAAISRQAAFLIGEEAEQLPGVCVEVEPGASTSTSTAGRRQEAPLARLGYTGRSISQELASCQDDGYQRDDLIGRAGIEASFERSSAAPTAAS